MEGDVRMKGLLYLHQQRFGKKWKKMWAEAMAESFQSVSRLELYEFSKKEGKKRAEGKRVIVLKECVQITERESDGCPKECSAFTLETSEKIYNLCCPREKIHDWITELCRLAFPKYQLERSRSVKQDVELHHTAEMTENSLYDTAESVKDFPVAAVETDAAVRCKLDGEYFLAPQSDRLLLKNRRTRQVVLSWPYHLVRKFGQDPTCFNFEAGRRCESGEGYFEFTTPHGEHLFNIVSGAIQNVPPQDESGTRPKERRVTNTPPETRKPSKKRVLTQSVSLSAIELSGKKENARSAGGESPGLIYASVSKPKGTSQNGRNSRQQNLPEFSPCYDLQEDEEPPDPLPPTPMFDVPPASDDYGAESVYSEVTHVDGYTTKEDFVDNPEDLDYFYRPEKSMCLDFPGQDGNLEELMEQLANLPAPSDYLEEPFYPGPEDYASVEQSVDNVDDVDCSYPPYESGVHFQSVPPSTMDSCEDGFATYDNLNIQRGK
ncbi:docking protein 3 [Trichomycterus rosablanca]|uniref:docking protein 3 n=1 Tax=Trichomycterus rosablanca TaxID=2290929 RepID=UPI002F3549B0